MASLTVVSPSFTIFLTTLLFSILLPFTESSSASSSSKTVYEVLEEYGFPIGLLPTSVTGYTLDSSTGEFTVTLNGTCEFTVDSYELKYSSTITGYISTDKLSSLSGVYVKVLFFWLSITTVTVADSKVDFSIGIASASFPVSNFATCPECGCGLDCTSLRIGGGDRDIEDQVLKVES